MAKQAIALRLDPGVLAWVDSYAKARKVSRQVVLETAVEAFKVDCEGGVPNLVPEPQKAVAPRRSGNDALSWAMDRQARLNDAKARRA